MQILAIFGHFWLKNTLSCILLNIGTLDIFDILHEVRDHCLNYYYFFIFFLFSVSKVPGVLCFLCLFYKQPGIFIKTEIAYFILCSACKVFVNLISYAYSEILECAKKIVSYNFNYIIYVSVHDSLFSKWVHLFFIKKFILGDQEVPRNGGTSCSLYTDFMDGLLQ